MRITTRKAVTPTHIRFSIIEGQFLVTVHDNEDFRTHNVSYDQWMEARRRAVFAICGYMAEEGMKE
jgi:hypothetical protein